MKNLSIDEMNDFMFLKSMAFKAVFSVPIWVDHPNSRLWLCSEWKDGIGRVLYENRSEDSHTFDFHKISQEKNEIKTFQSLVGEPLKQ